MVDTDQRLAEIRRLPRTPAHEIRQELYDDLERNALPWFTAENGRKCRASEAVDNRSGYALALMLMAKFAMWNEDWNGALVPLQALEELYGDFNEGNYPLAETQWRYKNPAESIFEIQHAWSLTGTQYNGNVAGDYDAHAQRRRGLRRRTPEGLRHVDARLVVAAGQQPLCDPPPRDGQYADRECGLRRRAVQPSAPDLRHLRRDAEPLYGEDRPRGAGRRGDPRAERSTAACSTSSAWATWRRARPSRSRTTTECPGPVRNSGVRTSSRTTIRTTTAFSAMPTPF